MSGFEFSEILSGSYHFVGEPAREHPMVLTLHARATRGLSFVRRPVVDIYGEVEAEELLDRQPLRGTLDMSVARTGRLRYRFELEAKGGRPCVFEGDRRLWSTEPVASMTLLRGAIMARAPVAGATSTEHRHNGARIAEVTLRFDLRRDLWIFLKSIRRA